MDRAQGLRRQLDHRRDGKTRGQDRHITTTQTPEAARHRPGDVQMATSDRKLLPETQGIQTHRHACLQNRYVIRSDDQPLRWHHQLTVTVNSGAANSNLDGE